MFATDIDFHPSLIIVGEAGSITIRVESCGLYYKTIVTVIYDHYDSGQYYNTRITIVIDNTRLSLCRQLRS